MTGVISVMLPSKRQLKVRGNPSPHFEAIDFLNNYGLRVALYTAIIKAKTGAKIVINIELED